MSLLSWLRERRGIGHREDAADAGYGPSRVRAAIRAGVVRRIRAKWIALDSAAPELVGAAESGGALTCVSLARRRGWWVPPDADGLLHLHLPANGAVRAEGIHAHWSKPLAPSRPRILEASVEDALADAAQCFALDQAVAIWESALRVEAISLDSLRRVPWRSASAMRCLEHVRPGTGSSLETVFHVRLSGWGVRLRCQVRLAGHDVDFLIGTHLIVQIDGWAHHSSSADRTRDLAHDAELRMRGYTVLRYSYAQVIYDWDHVERTLAAAMSRGLHLAPEVRRRA
ncbi:endonuclease domain-containing protein [Microbacterium sp. NPDC058345]|uniref:endonuclease domain-containing protein n=1 Tax=Microbacterium sp. NPDC058345 TaxID=3346455 RepID=UPI003656475D